MADVIADVKSGYGAVARSALSSRDAGVHAVAEAFGYSAEELAAVPAEANMGLSCGNPTAMANLRPGEVVVDLGSGGGLDVFLAAEKVGPSGRVIGIDMTEAMIDRARQNARRGPQGAPYANVEFHLSAIDRLPLADASVDVVISNCVINLAPDKGAVFREIARVLKPGGRVAVSDIAIKKTLPAELADSVMAYVGCIAGAITIDDYVAGLGDAGFADVAVVDAKADLNAYAKVENQSACCAPPMVSSSTLPLASGGCCGTDISAMTVHGGLADLLQKYDVNEYAASVKVFAIKPKSTGH
ncbi:MAG TPA: arsenite methyltransferase [Tepidisphaeraceae bacterium]|jgi:SAM-dependent methyltransferase